MMMTDSGMGARIVPQHHDNHAPMRLSERLRRLAPYFAPSRFGFALAIVGTIVAAATEPLIPALMQPLLDRGFQQGGLPLWLVPVVVIGIFAVRGIAGFVAQYGLSWAANARRRVDAAGACSASSCRRSRRCSRPIRRAA